MTMQMFPADMMITAHDSTRKQTPHVLDCIDVSSIFSHVPDIVINRSVTLTGRSELVIGSERVAVQFRVFSVDPRFHDGGNIAAVQVLHVMGTNFTRPALDNTDDRRFLLRSATPFQVAFSSGRASPP